MNGRRRDVETRYRVLRRQQRRSTVRLIVLVTAIAAVAIWWLVRNVRS